MQTANNQDEIPYRVNEAQMVGPFSATELAPVAVMCVVGVALNMTNIALLFGGSITILQIKLGKNFPKGFILHYLWFQGLIPTKITKYIPDPIQRRFFQ